MSRMAPFIDGGRTVDRTNWSNTVISYYPFGGAIALALDLTLRDRSDSRRDARRLHARDVAHATASRAAAAKATSIMPYTIARRRGDAGGGQRRSPRSRATSSRDTSRATRSPTTRACWRAPGSRCASAIRARLARRPPARVARRRAARRAGGADVAHLRGRARSGRRAAAGRWAADQQRVAMSQSALARRKPGDTVQVVFVDRTGAQKTATIKLAADPAPRGRARRARRHADRGAENFSRRWLASDVTCLFPGCGSSTR